MKKVLLLILLLTLVVLASVGCDLLDLPFLSKGTTTAEMTTTTTTAATTAPATTEAPWLLDLDLSDYVALDAEDYKNPAISLPSPEAITPADVEDYLVDLKFKVYKDSLVSLTSGTVAKNDTVLLRYRGEVNIGTADAPHFVEFFGGSNYLDSAAHSLRIGSNSFIAGFEDALIGIAIEETAITLEKDADKVVGVSGDVAYVTYKYSYTVEGAARSGTQSDRVDLRRDPDGNYTGISRYSSALRDALLGLHTGEYIKTGGENAAFTESFDITGDLVPEAVTLTDVQVVGVVTEERVAVIDVPFPEGYDEALGGKSARWYVAIERIDRLPAEAAEPSYTFVSEEIGITYDSLLALTGEDAVLTEAEISAIGEDTEKQKAAVLASYKDYILAVMRINQKNEVKEAVWEDFADYIIEAITVKGYPEKIRADYISAFRESAEQSYLQYSSYYTFYEFLAAYYGTTYFPDEDAIDAGFERIAEIELRYEMAVYAIAEAEGLGVAEGERASTAAAERRELIEYYKSAHGTEYTETELIEGGYTDRYLIESLYFSRTKDYITDLLFSRITVE